LKFIATGLAGAFLIEPELHSDDRGFFARSFCQKEFAERGLADNFVQCNISFNKLKGTVRGMHYQKPPHGEAKLVRCTMGKIFDVIVDIRKNSQTFGKWFATELSADNRHMLFISEGLAHGFQTLENDCEIFYQMSDFFAPEFASGFRYNDPTVGIEWPIEVKKISSRDANLPMFNERFLK
jgi:dTDP-4-dehydrorhamnose 3,5-epimerase